MGTGASERFSSETEIPNLSLRSGYKARHTYSRNCIYSSMAVTHYLARKSKAQTRTVFRHDRMRLER